MSSPADLDIDGLLAPIPGDDPAGQPLSDELARALDEWRKESDSVDPNAPKRKADWGAVVEATTRALREESKDLVLAVRLLEAKTNRDGLPGLRDGLELLRRLVGECGDRLHPRPEGDDYGAWGRPLNWFNDPSRAGRFPASVLRVPPLREDAPALTGEAWLTRGRRGECEAAIAALKPACAARLRASARQLAEARAALAGLSKLLQVVMKGDAPDYLGADSPDGNLGAAFAAYAQLLNEVARQKGIDLANGPPVAGAAGAAGVVVTAEVATLVPGPGGASRDELYRRVGEIAATLERLEPHSPVPLLLKRCVRLGGMAFPELMRELVREVSTLDEFDRLLGKADAK